MDEPNLRSETKSTVELENDGSFAGNMSGLGDTEGQYIEAEEHSTVNIGHSTSQSGCLNVTARNLDWDSRGEESLRDSDPDFAQDD